MRRNAIARSPARHQRPADVGLLVGHLVVGEPQGLALAEQVGVVAGDVPALLQRRAVVPHHHLAVPAELRPPDRVDPSRPAVQAASIQAVLDRLARVTELSQLAAADRAVLALGQRPDRLGTRLPAG
jgi:hypothetical protein